MKIKYLYFSFLFSCITINLIAQESQTYTDSRDGKIYKTIKIANQIWFAENVNIQTDTGSWCYNNNLDNSNIYGRLYNWEIANNICPVGWHLPSNDEFQILVDYLGGYFFAGGKLKEKGNSHWSSSNDKITNESGFSAFPAGYRNFNGDFFNQGSISCFWTSTMMNGSYASYYFFVADDTKAYQQIYIKTNALSVRCIKDK